MGMDVFEAMETCRSIRRLKPDPIPDSVLDQLVHYATRAASAGNSQLWKFIIVTDEADRVWFRDMLVAATASRVPAEPPPPDDQSVMGRNMRMYHNFIHNWHEIPAFIITAIENGFPDPEHADPQFMWSSVFCATQNLLLAARAMGIGAAMTTCHKENEPAVRERFGIPDEVGIGATIPLGYPIGKYGPLTRKPIAEVIYRNRWGAI